MQMHTINTETAEDQALCRMIALLMVNAKFLQGSICAALTRDTAAQKQGIHDLLMAVAEVSKGDGIQLEKDALMLAQKLGIQVHQSYATQSSGGVN